MEGIESPLNLGRARGREIRPRGSGSLIHWILDIILQPNCPFFSFYIFNYWINPGFGYFIYCLLALRCIERSQSNTIQYAMDSNPILSIWFTRGPDERTIETAM
jgi:hypothetical protein